MNFIHKEIIINTHDKTELINITPKIIEIIKSNNIDDALINISTKHTTSAIIINEDEKGLKKDILYIFDEIIPFSKYYHDMIDNNARSHLKSILTTSNQTLPIKDGKLCIGTWQSIFFVEFDGSRRNRKISITIIN